MPGTASATPERGFRGRVSATVWARLVQAGRRCEYRAGEWLIRRGEPGGWLLTLVAGRVTVRFADADGVEVVLAVRGPGDLLGEFSRLDSGPRSASVRAMEPCIGYVIWEPRFAELVRQHRLDAVLDTYVLTKIRESTAPTWQLARYRPARRLAQLMTAVIDAAGPDHPRPHVVPMSQEELAAALGLARSSVTPVLADWRRDGVIRTGRSSVLVVDVARLRSVAETPGG
jgi:CRP/FNR family transcriptional regulator, cyclic AMP receptor protein